MKSIAYKKGAPIMETEVEHIIEWLQQQVEEANVNGLLVGVSGGLDSAVVANLIKRAFPDESLGIILPLKNSEADIQDAHDVVDKCDIEHMTIDLTKTHETLWSEIQPHFTNKKNEENPLTDANLRARLRMGALYTVATDRRYLVVGTDNASEWYTGYFTKYGDGGVDILPLVQYTKKEVREMAAYLGVPKNIIEKNPSADLWDGQTDETEMGTTYDKIDAYLNNDAIPKKDEDLIEKMHQKTEHKRRIPQIYQRTR